MGRGALAASQTGSDPVSKSEIASCEKERGSFLKLDHLGLDGDQGLGVRLSSPAAPDTSAGAPSQGDLSVCRWCCSRRTTIIGNDEGIVSVPPPLFLNTDTLSRCQSSNFFRCLALWKLAKFSLHLVRKDLRPTRRCNRKNDTLQGCGG